MERRKKWPSIGIIILLLVLVVGIYLNTQQQKQEQQESYQFPAPEAVVRQYFQAWNEQDYVNMYATFSDGFKKTDLEAKDLAAFKSFASTQGITRVNIITIQEKSNNGKSAEVDYAVEFILNEGRKQPFAGTFTLKYRPGDVIQGWKLIHPYGENIDSS